jgi:hypothetical protein
MTKEGWGNKTQKVPQLHLNNEKKDNPLKKQRKNAIIAATAETLISQTPRANGNKANITTNQPQSARPELTNRFVNNSANPLSRRGSTVQQRSQEAQKIRKNSTTEKSKDPKPKKRGKIIPAIFPDHLDFEYRFEDSIKELAKRIKSQSSSSVSASATTSEEPKLESEQMSDFFKFSLTGLRVSINGVENDRDLLKFYIENSRLDIDDKETQDKAKLLSQRAKQLYEIIDEIPDHSENCCDAQLISEAIETFDSAFFQGQSEQKNQFGFEKILFRVYQTNQNLANLPFIFYKYAILRELALISAQAKNAEQSKGIYITSETRFESNKKTIQGAFNRSKKLRQEALDKMWEFPASQADKLVNYLANSGAMNNALIHLASKKPDIAGLNLPENMMISRDQARGFQAIADAKKTIADRKGGKKEGEVAEVIIQTGGGKTFMSSQLNSQFSQVITVNLNSDLAEVKKNIESITEPSTCLLQMDEAFFYDRLNLHQNETETSTKAETKEESANILTTQTAKETAKKEAIYQFIEEQRARGFLIVTYGASESLEKIKHDIAELSIMIAQEEVIIESKKGNLEEEVRENFKTAIKRFRDPESYSGVIIISSIKDEEDYRECLSIIEKINARIKEKINDENFTINSSKFKAENNERYSISKGAKHYFNDQDEELNNLLQEFDAIINQRGTSTSSSRKYPDPIQQTAANFNNFISSLGTQNNDKVSRNRRYSVIDHQNSSSPKNIETTAKTKENITALLTTFLQDSQQALKDKIENLYRISDGGLISTNWSTNKVRKNKLKEDAEATINYLAIIGKEFIEESTSEEEKKPAKSKVNSTTLTKEQKDKKTEIENKINELDVKFFRQPSLVNIDLINEITQKFRSYCEDPESDDYKILAAVFYEKLSSAISNKLEIQNTSIISQETTFNATDVYKTLFYLHKFTTIFDDVNFFEELEQQEITRLKQSRDAKISLYDDLTIRREGGILSDGKKVVGKTKQRFDKATIIHKAEPITINQEDGIHSSAKKNLGDVVLDLLPDLSIQNASSSNKARKLQYKLLDYVIDETNCSESTLQAIQEKTKADVIILPHQDAALGFCARVYCKNEKGEFQTKNFRLGDANENENEEEKRQYLKYFLAHHQNSEGKAFSYLTSVSFFDYRNFIGGDYDIASIGITDEITHCDNFDTLNYNLLMQANRDRTYRPSSETDSVARTFIYHQSEINELKDVNGEIIDQTRLNEVRYAMHQKLTENTLIDDKAHNQASSNVRKSRYLKQNNTENLNQKELEKINNQLSALEQTEKLSQEGKINEITDIQSAIKRQTSSQELPQESDEEKNQNKTDLNDSIFDLTEEQLKQVSEAIAEINNLNQNPAATQKRSGATPSVEQQIYLEFLEICQFYEPDTSGSYGKELLQNTDEHYKISVRKNSRENIIVVEFFNNRKNQVFNIPNAIEENITITGNNLKRSSSITILKENRTEAVKRENQDNINANGRDIESLEKILAECQEVMEKEKARINVAKAELDKLASEILEGAELTEGNLTDSVRLKGIDTTDFKKQNYSLSSNGNGGFKLTTTTQNQNPQPLESSTKKASRVKNNKSLIIEIYNSDNEIKHTDLNRFNKIKDFLSTSANQKKQELFSSISGLLQTIQNSLSQDFGEPKILFDLHNPNFFSVIDEEQISNYQISDGKIFALTVDNSGLKGGGEKENGEEKELSIFQMQKLNSKLSEIKKEIDEQKERQKEAELKQFLEEKKRAELKKIDAEKTNLFNQSKEILQRFYTLTQAAESSSGGMKKSSSTFLRLLDDSRQQTSSQDQANSNQTKKPTIIFRHLDKDNEVNPKAGKLGDVVLEMCSHDKKGSFQVFYAPNSPILENQTSQTQKRKPYIESQYKDPRDQKKDDSDKTQIGFVYSFDSSTEKITKQKVKRFISGNGGGKEDFIRVGDESSFSVNEDKRNLEKLEELFRDLSSANQEVEEILKKHEAELEKKIAEENQKIANLETLSQEHLKTTLETVQPNSSISLKPPVQPQDNYHAISIINQIEEMKGKEDDIRKPAKANEEVLNQNPSYSSLEVHTPRSEEGRVDHAIPSDADSNFGDYNPMNELETVSIASSANIDHGDGRNRLNSGVTEANNPLDSPSDYLSEKNDHELSFVTIHEPKTTEDLWQEFAQNHNLRGKILERIKKLPTYQSPAQSNSFEYLNLSELAETKNSSIQRGQVISFTPSFDQNQGNSDSAVENITPLTAKNVEIDFDKPITLSNLAQQPIDVNNLNQFKLNVGSNLFLDYTASFKEIQSDEGSEDKSAKVIFTLSPPALNSLPNQSSQNLASTTTPLFHKAEIIFNSNESEIAETKFYNQNENEIKFDKNQNDVDPFTENNPLITNESQQAINNQYNISQLQAALNALFSQLIEAKKHEILNEVFDELQPKANENGFLELNNQFSAKIELDQNNDKIIDLIDNYVPEGQDPSYQITIPADYRYFVEVSKIDQNQKNIDDNASLEVKFTEPNSLENSTRNHTTSDNSNIVLNIFSSIFSSSDRRDFSPNLYDIGDAASSEDISNQVDIDANQVLENLLSAVDNLREREREGKREEEAAIKIQSAWRKIPAKKILEELKQQQQLAEIYPQIFEVANNFNQTLAKISELDSDFTIQNYNANKEEENDKILHDSVDVKDGADRSIKILNNEFHQGFFVNKNDIDGEGTEGKYVIIVYNVDESDTENRVYEKSKVPVEDANLMLDLLNNDLAILKGIFREKEEAQRLAEEAAAEAERQKQAAAIKAAAEEARKIQYQPSRRDYSEKTHIYANLELAAADTTFLENSENKTRIFSITEANKIFSALRKLDVNWQKNEEEKGKAGIKPNEASLTTGDYLSLIQFADKFNIGKSDLEGASFESLWKNIRGTGTSITDREKDRDRQRKEFAEEVMQKVKEAINDNPDFSQNLIKFMADHQNEVLGVEIKREDKDYAKGFVKKTEDKGKKDEDIDSENKTLKGVASVGEITNKNSYRNKVKAALSVLLKKDSDGNIIDDAEVAEEDKPDVTIKPTYFVNFKNSQLEEINKNVLDVFNRDEHGKVKQNNNSGR